MNRRQIDIFQKNRIEIFEMILTNANNQLELLWKFRYETVVHKITFYNVSRFSIRDLSIPLEVHGIEIIDHSQNGWEKDSTYEICDFEDDRVHFFCEYFKMDE